jgi:hypothetical protein
MCGPVEIAAINNHTADRIAMSAEILGRGIDDDRGAVLKRPCEDWRCGIVDDERNAERTANAATSAIGKDRQFRVGQCFGVIG